MGHIKMNCFMLGSQVKADGSDQFLFGQLSVRHFAAKCIEKLRHFFVSIKSFSASLISLASYKCGLNLNMFLGGADPIIAKRINSIWRSAAWYCKPGRFRLIFDLFYLLYLN
jgi:hypothetical protein